MYAIQKNCFEDFYLWCEKRFLEFEGPLSPIDATPRNQSLDSCLMPRLQKPEIPLKVST